MFWAIRINIIWQWPPNSFSSKSNCSPNSLEEEFQDVLEFLQKGYKFLFYFIYQLFWTQAYPEGMCINGTQVSCEVPSLPNPTTRQGWPHHRNLRPLLFLRNWCGFFFRPTRTNQWKCCEMEPAVFRSYPRRLESLTICRCHYKGLALSSQLFKDPECCSGLGLNPRPPAQQTGALPTELTRQR